MDSATSERDGLKLTRIGDNARERLMPLSLFGKLPQELIDSLNIGKGIPSSVSTFLLEAVENRRYFLDYARREKLFLADMHQPEKPVK